MKQDLADQPAFRLELCSLLRRPPRATPLFPRGALASSFSIAFSGGGELIKGSAYALVLVALMGKPRTAPRQR